MPENQYTRIVEMASQYIRDHLGERLTVEIVAESTFCSSRNLRRAFNHVTGQAVLAYINTCRIKSSQELLVHTGMNVSEIADQVGFPDAFHFSKVFKKITGVPPSQFRASGQIVSGTPVTPEIMTASRYQREWLTADLSKRRLPDWCAVEYGSWTTGDGRLRGSGENEFRLKIKRPLPENFRVELRVRFQGPPGELSLSLGDSHRSGKLYSFRVGTQGNTTGTLQVRGRPYQWNPLAVFALEDQYHVSLELSENHLCLRMQDRPVLRLVEPFPPSYQSRSILRIEGWRNPFEISEFRIFDLGYASMLRPLRQGDALYAAGLFDQAGSYYMRLLSSISDPAETMELRYKIGMCFARQGMWDQAREWFSRVMSLPEADFWYELTQVAFTEYSVHEENWQAVGKQLSKGPVNPVFHDGVRALLDQSRMDCVNRGFHTRAVRCAEMVSRIDPPDSIPARQAAHNRGLSQLAGGDLAAARKTLLGIVAGHLSTEPVVLEALRNLSLVHSLLGEFDQSEAVLDRITAEHSRRSTLVDVEMRRRFNIAGTHGPEAELNHVRKTMKTFPDRKGACGLLRQSEILLLGSLGWLQDMNKAFRSHQQISSATHKLSGRSGFALHPVLMFREKWADLAEFLLKTLRGKSGNLAFCASAGVLAGIARELGGQPKAAEEIWAEAIRRFPSERVNWYADLADRLSKSGRDQLESMPYHPWTKSQLMYWTGLLWEKRGNRKRSKQLLEMCVKEDATNRWPTVLAKRRLSDTT